MLGLDETVVSYEYFATFRTTRAPPSSTSMSYASLASFSGNVD
jgi:hypothetical protein